MSRGNKGGGCPIHPEVYEIHGQRFTGAEMAARAKALLDVGYLEPTAVRPNCALSWLQQAQKRDTRGPDSG